MDCGEWTMCGMYNVLSLFLSLSNKCSVGLIDSLMVTGPASPSIANKYWMLMLHVFF